MIFENRNQAGKILAKELSKLKLNCKKSIIVAIPRGGVVVGKAISQTLSVPLTVIVIKKLGAPFNAELAIGATASRGRPVLDRWLIRDLKVSPDYLKKEILKKKKEAVSRERYLNVRLDEKIFSGKDVIVVDDGLATGQTAKAACYVIRQFQPSGIILAVPCAAPSAIDLVKEVYDKVVCLEVDPELVAVGQFYRDFRPIEDEEVATILKSKI